MTQSRRRLSDLTIDELIELIRSAVRDVLEEERQPLMIKDHPQAGLLDIPPVSVGEWKPGLKLISREEYYDDDEPTDEEILTGLREAMLDVLTGNTRPADEVLAELKEEFGD